jgi:hypothetical protein
MDASRVLFVVGIICRKQTTRAFVSERTWAYQTKSAFSDPHRIPSRTRNHWQDGLGTENALLAIREPTDGVADDKPTNEMVRRLIPQLDQEDRGGSF